MGLISQSQKMILLSNLYLIIIKHLGILDRTLRLLFFISITISLFSATWFDDIPRTITQPDGETFDCFVTGDQYGRRLHDRNDFTIILDPEDGYYYYADRGPDGNLDANGYEGRTWRP